MKKFLTIVFSALVLNGCNVPQAPLQPDNGVIVNIQQRTTKTFGLSGRFSRFTNKNLVSQSDIVTIKNIPYFKQGQDNTCGQASMTSVLNFWGVDVSYQTVINDTNPGNLPTNTDTIEKYMISKGLNAKSYKNGTLEYLKLLVDQGKPTIVLLDFGGLQNEHYVVVSGYSDNRQLVIINDPKQGANLGVSYAQFEEMWKNQSLANLIIFGDKFYKAIFDISK